MNDRFNHGPWIFVVLLALGLLWGCAVPFGQVSPRQTAGARPVPRQVVPEKVVSYLGGPRLDHPLHLENDLDCTDCHELDDETGEPGMPSWDTCADCHEQPEEGEELDEDEVKLAGVHFDKDQKPLWRRAIAGYDAEIKFSHKAHAKIEKCSACHGDMKATEAGRVAGQLFDMAACEKCHEENQAANSCETCHSELRKTVKPPSHDGGWQGAHGDVANRLRLTATQHDCSLCHVEPNDCDNCHQSTRPSSHDRGWRDAHGAVVAASGSAFPQDCAFCHKTSTFCDDCHQVTKPRSHKHQWKRRHGQFVHAAGGDLPSNCSICHSDRSFCEKCHLDEEPRSHTTLFRTRTHGVMAAIDRRACATCHQVHFCVRCHEDTPPRSHRGMFARRSNTHCVQCHFPISSNDSCKVCHKTNPTHSTAPAQPGNHIPGRNCRVCHNAVGGGGAPPMRHVDNGQNCELCHQ